MTQTDDLPAAFRLRVALRQDDLRSVPARVAREATEHVMNRLDELDRLPPDEVQMSAIILRDEASWRTEFGKIAAFCRALDQFRAAGA